jgi:hypothetical protein
MEPATALEYERRERVPPYVESAPGRVTLVMPPPPRWLAVGAVVAVTLIWAYSVALALGAAFVWWRVPGAPPQTRPAIVVLSIGAALMSMLVVGGLLWLRGDSRLPFRVEISDDTLSYNWPGPFSRLRTHRRPVERVRHVRARERSMPLVGMVVDLRVALRPFGTIQRVFRSPHAGFAGEVEAAFMRVLEDGRDG